ncbi:MAG: hypothetical protein IT165_32620 [Bryobacterales bacterium]|nr:hypothetical protein [Bryobacterales bacterium]
MPIMTFPSANISWRLLITAVIILTSVSAQWKGEMTVEVRAREPGVQTKRPETAARIILDRIYTLSLRSPRDQWERDHVTGGEKSVRQVLSVSPRGLAGMTTIADPAGDVFAARWVPSAEDLSLGVSGIAIWDTPEYNFLILECAQSKFETTPVTGAFLKRLVAWKREDPYLRSVKVWLGRMPYGMLMAGSGALEPHFPIGTEFTLEAWQRGANVDLVLQIGKAVFGGLYPEGSAYVAERFPPFRERVATWPREKVFAEIGKTWKAQGPSQGYPNRDKILIREALSRNPRLEEVESLLVAQAPTGYALLARVDVVMKVLMEQKKVSQYRDAIVQSILALDRIPQARSVQRIFALLVFERKEDFSREALDCAMRCAFPEAPGFPLGPYMYLAERATPETAQRLAEADVPERLRKMKAWTLEQIALRLSGERHK